MRNDRERIDHDQPALVVTYGNTARKHRPLDKDLLVLGRSPASDVHLVSPDVAPVHCVLARLGGNWHLRDCSNRPGTRVNGKVIHEALLDDGDIIQVGSFTFEVRLPAGQAPALSPSRVARLERARRNVLRIALALRKRLGNRKVAFEEADVQVKAQRLALVQQVESLKTHQRDYELRMTRLELSERDLATDRSTLEKEYRVFQEEVERHAVNVRLFQERVAAKEKELEERRAAVHAEIGALWRQWQQRSQASGAAPTQQEPPPTERGQAEGTPVEPGLLFAEAEAALCRQRTEFERLVAELRGLLEEVRSDQKLQLEAFRQENERLQQELRALEQRWAEVVRLPEEEPVAEATPPSVGGRREANGHCEQGNAQRPT